MLYFYSSGIARSSFGFQFIAILHSVTGFLTETENPVFAKKNWKFNFGYQFQFKWL
uniref:Uncharacterized protein n=1 Tax=Arundo donax TaxID=35708 RepID=A0A0A8YUE9_ARUDO